DLAQTKIDVTHDHILTLMSYAGCGASSLFLGITLMTYLTLEKVQTDNPSEVLLSLCAVMLMLNIVFLTDSWLTSFNQPGLCITHSLFDVYVPKYILKCCIVDWGIPAIVITLVLIINKDFYGGGSLTKSRYYSNFCCIQNNTVFYTSIVAYFFLIFLINTAMFIAVLLQIHSVKRRTQKTFRFWKRGVLQDLKSAFSLMFILGLTWDFAFFAWGAVRIFFLYLFSIFNTLQEFFIFVFHCLMKDEIVKQCQVHFGWGRFHLSRYSAEVHCSPSSVSPEDDETNHSLSGRILSMDTGLHYHRK
ncbi:hypothetical protein IHE44_0003330, partial [Lamprotornis superbus]